MLMLIADVDADDALRSARLSPLSAYHRGTLSLEEAGRRTELVTAQYTKRQATWFRHHHLAGPAASEIIPSRFTDATQLSESLLQTIFAFIQGRD